MAIRTSSTTARSSSHSTQSAPKKSSSAQRSGSASRSSAPTQSKQTSSAPKRDKFTRSTPTAKQTPSKTSATSTTKTSTASKSSQAKTSAAKSNTTAKTSSSKTVTKAKSNPTASKAKRDSFEFSSEAVKKSVQSAKSSKSSANSKATTKSSTKNSANAQTKKAVKNNSSSKGSTSGNVSKDKANSSQEKMLESIKKAYAHTKDPKQRAAMRKTMNDISREISSKKTNKTNKTTDLLVKYDRSKIKSQFEYYLGDRACYATSADNMWRVNDGAVGDKIIKLADEHKNDGVITGASCNENYTYISDSGKVFKTNGQNVVKEYCGKDENKKEYTAVRIQGLSKDDYTELVLQELNKDKIVCVRVVNNVGDDPKNGHTMNIVGTNSQGEFLYENCGRYPTPLSTLKPATLADTGYTNNSGVKREYFEVQDGQYEIWIDTTK